MTKRFILSVDGVTVARGMVRFNAAGHRVAVAMTGRAKVLRAIAGAVRGAEERARDAAAIVVHGEEVPA
jgi:hypothetical protein